MGNMRPIDSAVVKNETYDVLSADTMGGEYIETIGAACQNPDGYTSGSLFLGKDNDVQHLYRATAAIAFGETIILDTNCVYTTVSSELEGKAEESEVTSLNEALTNEMATRVANGAHNIFDVNAVKLAGSPLSGIDVSINSDGEVTLLAGTTTGEFYFTNSYVRSGAAIPFKPNTSYVFSIGKNKKQNSLYLQVLVQETSGSSWTTLASQNGVDSVTFTTPATIYDVYVRVESPQGNAITATTLTPMITLATDANADFEPYAMTNRELTNAVTMNRFSSSVNISGYVESSPYVCPSDGYVRMAVKGNVKGLVCIEGADGVTTGSAYLMIGTSQPLNDSTSTVLRFSCPVYKGMRVYCQDIVAEALFIPLKV